MQINKIQPTTFGQKPILKQMKYKLGLAGMLLSELGYAAKDIFVPRKKVYVNVGGKMIDERDLPNSVTGPSDTKGLTWQKVEFYPEDVEKMKNMTTKERIKYKGQLIEQDRYKLGEIVGKS